MKSLRLLPCLLLGIALLLTPCRAFAQEPLRDGDIGIAAPSAILMEKVTGQVLYEKNADERLLPASVTKVMTLLLIIEDIESGKLSLDDTVTASARAASFGGSCVYLEEGEQMSVHEMLKCITVASANDCAVAMAEHLSGTEALFVERMNARAEELGLQNTHFTNCTGALRGCGALQLRQGYRSHVPGADLPSAHQGLQHHLDGQHPGRELRPDQHQQAGLLVRGLHRAENRFYQRAMYCLSATAERDDTEYIAVVMHADSSDSRNADATALLNYGFARYALCPLLPETPLPDLPVELGAAGTVSLRAEGEAAALIPKGSAQPDYRLDLPERVTAPVEAGDVLGSLTVRLGEETLAVLPVAAAESVPRIGVRPLFLRLLGL